MRLATLMLGTAVVGLLAGGAGGGEAKKAGLKGTWNATKILQFGKEEDPKNTSLTFKGNTFTLRKGDKLILTGTYKADWKKKPHEIDLILKEGPKKGKEVTAKGIFEIRGDTLKLCSGKGGEDHRPKDFSAAEGSPQVLITFTRAKE
jgi:uncharacterized protein (TIGR03067 family)